VSPQREPLPSRAPDAPDRPQREPLPADAAGLPQLPDEFHATLRHGLSELRLDLTSAQLDALDAYVRLLLRWTAAINLTAIREPEAVARDHLLDSLSAVPVLRSLGASSVVDLGSGGGLPGIPLAIAMPELRELLVESVGKKAAFLRTAVAAGGSMDLPSRVEVASERAEDLAVRGRERERWDAVTVRAVGSISELIELALPLLRIGGSLVAWKRDPFADELAAGRNEARAMAAELTVHEVAAGGLEDHRLVVVTKTRPTPNRYPRPPADLERRPL